MTISKFGVGTKQNQISNNINKNQGIKQFQANMAPLHKTSTFFGNLYYALKFDSSCGYSCLAAYGRAENGWKTGEGSG